MKAELKKLDKLKRVLKIEVSETTLAKDKEIVCKELSKKLKVPGFRPGTAPLEVIEKHHKEVIREEFLKSNLPSYYAKALEDNGLTPVGFPRIYDVKFDNKNLIFSAEFEVKPEPELKDEDYKNLKVKTKPLEVKEIEVEKLITQLKDNVKKITKKDHSDEELAKWAGYPSVDILREAIRAEIFIDKLRAWRSDIENIVMEQLLKKVTIDVPNSLIQEQHNKLIQQEMYNLKAKGIEDKDIKKYEDDIKDKLKPLAIKQVKLYYILEKVAQRESLEVDPRSLFDVVTGYILSCAQYIT